MQDLAQKEKSFYWQIVIFFLFENNDLDDVLKNNPKNAFSLAVNSNKFPLRRFEFQQR